MGGVRLELYSNYGTSNRFGLTEIQLLDMAGCVLPVHPCDVTTTNTINESRHPSVLFNGEEDTTLENYMWSCEKEEPDFPVEIHISLPRYQTNVFAIRIYNWNDPNSLDVCVKNVRLYLEGSATPFFRKPLHHTGPTRIRFPGSDRKKGQCASYQRRVKAAMFSAFTRHGRRVARHPLLSMILPVLLCGLLGLGLVNLKEETDMKYIYFPKTSRATQDRQVVEDVFPEMNRSSSYNPYSLTDFDEAVNLIFESKAGSIFNQDALAEIEGIVRKVKELTWKSGGRMNNYSNICARKMGRCAVDGEYVLMPSFQRQLAAGHVTYPFWDTRSPLGNLMLFTAVSGVELTQRGVLESASVIRISLKLQKGTRPWQEKFLTLARSLDPVWMRVAYSVPFSLNDELDRSTHSDVRLFFLTFVIMLMYASMVTCGGDPVSTRATLALGGVVAAGISILGAFGMLALCGVEFVNTIGAVPFIVIGIGVDDMFLLMSSWSETLSQPQLTVAARMGATFGKAGIGITITSLTDFLAFLVGTTSTFRSVTNFSLYAGVAVVLCYFCNITFFGGCLTYHGRRVYSSRHFLTCRKVATRRLQREGEGRCNRCCRGSPPIEIREDESVCEKLPRLLLPKFIFSRWTRNTILCGFVVYLALAIYGTVHLKQGLVLSNLVSESSYYHRYLTLTERYFPDRLPVGFIVRGEVDYYGSGGQRLKHLLERARGDPNMDAQFLRCWLVEYTKSSFFDPHSPRDFNINLAAFLTDHPEFRADVVLDISQTIIVASRCFVMSEPISDPYAQADVMVRMRELSDASPLPVFAFHWAFVAYEQFLAVLPSTLKMVGCAVLVMALVTSFFLPHILLVLFVTLTILMILVGIFGFMHFWGLSLSSITMIHLVMTVGFSVDFSAHVCAAYLVSTAHRRQDRAYDAITHAASPIFNGAVSTLLGVLLLVLSDSYIFQAFCRVMLLVIVFCTGLGDGLAQ